MKDRYNVLFVCTGNSARSQMAEALANSMGKGRVRAFSAGSHPAGRVHPMALQVMTDAGLEVSVLHSKRLADYAQPGAPEMDLVITVCDRAAGESCPVWPGQPITAHWSIPDPAAVTGTPEQVRKAFSNAFLLLQQRISLLLSLRMEGLDRLAAATRLRQISETPTTA
ncbi:arsenate reductase ArsC [Lysobacter arvi]|uniref:Arsenate reductase ArsC n=1 Tax=Lysobacter arvi TaxID=3038776 RepID=A0ABU1CH02_9GAMM|nr:arsenate reductase ArsC [Lysobacter arvi]MDR0184237.1 arsenate reductase ArsC [Lysobacter arvi]